MFLWAFRGVYALHREIDALGKTVGPAGRHDVFFAQDRSDALDRKARARAVVGDHAVAEDDALVGLELDLQRHVPSRRTIEKGKAAELSPRRPLVGLYQKTLAEQFEHRLVRLIG